LDLRWEKPCLRGATGTAANFIAAPGSISIIAIIDSLAFKSS